MKWKTTERELLARATEMLKAADRPGDIHYNPETGDTWFSPAEELDGEELSSLLEDIERYHAVREDSWTGECKVADALMQDVERWSIEERMAFYRCVFVRAAKDTATFTYYHGRERQLRWQVAELFGYFACNTGLDSFPDGVNGLVSAIRQGWFRAEEHDRQSRASWEARRKLKEGAE